MDFSSWSPVELLEGIQDVKETLETYKDGNLNEEEKKNYEEMVKLLAALESEREKLVEGVRISKKPALMTSADLEQAMEEIDDERKMFCRERRGTKWSEDDEKEYERMNAWAAAILDEMMRRA
jgi:hypothetical protein